MSTQVKVAVIMENLLPTVPSTDVISNHFRETNLPYQQWEAKRTHFTPRTPSDIAHLLPPIVYRKGRQGESNPLSTELRIRRPCPAPIDRYISDRYDPALDPSPIGAEERGVVKPIRITRILPRSERESREVQGTKILGVYTSSVKASVTILNGYNNIVGASIGYDSAGNTQDGTGVDVYLQASSRFVEHATLLPSQCIRRTLQTPKSSTVVTGYCTLETNEVSSGLTVFLGCADDWSNCDNIHNPHAWSGLGSNTTQNIPEVVLRFNEALLEASAEEVTRYIFQAEDGRPGPSRNAFRLQFEPGPLGMELEEDPGGRGIVQIRCIRQAGQAEKDGRLSVGSLIVAVGDWGHCDFGPFEPNATKAENRFDEGERPVIVRSLADLEEFILSREPDQLFFLWAIDRDAPEVLSALGVPNSHPENDSRSHFSGFKGPPFTANAAIVGIGAANTCSASTASDHGSRGVPPYTIPGITDQLAGLPMQEGALEWDSSSSTPDRAKWGKQVLKDAHLGICEEDNIRAVRSDANLPLVCESSERVGAVSPTTEGVGHPPKSEDSKGTNNNLRLHGQEPGSAQGKWEFATEGGKFNEDDEGLAARREPSRDHRERTSVERGFVPLGLQASSTDELTVYVWFSNNHASATMQVSWIDYDGKRIPRRSLLPGECYFERSFATHPWVIQGVSRTDEDGSGDASSLMTGPQQSPQCFEQGARNCCIFRLGNAMATARLTGSLIWNPAGKTISFIKQTKLGVASKTPCGITSEGGGLDPSKRRLCTAGADREAETERAIAARAAVRAEKARILEEMRSSRMYPPGGVGKKAGKHLAREGLGVGAPNLRFVMIGSNTI